jgi:Flp pilus assembly protein TadD
MPRREQIEELLTADPADVFLNYALAKALVTEGRPADAVAQFRRVLELDPAHVAAHFQLGQVLAEEGDVPAARQVVAQGISLAVRTGDQHAAAEMTGFLESLD